MRIAAAASVLLHGLVLGAALTRWHPAGPVEVPARIEMVFGTNAQSAGAAASPVKAAVAAPPAAASAPPASVQPGPPRPSPPDPRNARAAAPTAATQPVRLGDGLVGFDVPKPDVNIVEAQADPGNRPPPPPEEAFARGEHGRVLLRIHVRPDGLVGSIETLQSSGYADLDETAIVAAQRWRFIPQLRDGEAIASVRDQSFDFELR